MRPIDADALWRKMETLRCKIKRSDFGFLWPDSEEEILDEH